MITKGVTPEQKAPVLCKIDCQTKFVGSGEQTFYKRKVNFTPIDYLFWALNAKLDTGGTGTGHVKINFDATEKLDQSVETDTTEKYVGFIDCTSITGFKSVEIIGQGATDFLIIEGFYLGVVDA